MHRSSSMEWNRPWKVSLGQNIATPGREYKAESLCENGKRDNTDGHISIANNTTKGNGRTTHETNLYRVTDGKIWIQTQIINVTSDIACCYFGMKSCEATLDLGNILHYFEKMDCKGNYYCFPLPLLHPKYETRLQELLHFCLNYLKKEQNSFHPLTSSLDHFDAESTNTVSMKERKNWKRLTITWRLPLWSTNDPFDEMESSDSTLFNSFSICWSLTDCCCWYGPGAPCCCWGDWPT